MKSLWCVLLVLIVASQAVIADDKDPNDANDPNELLRSKSDAVIKDPNELLLAKWDAVIKDPNDPNELLKAKWDAVVKILQTKDINQKVKEKVIDEILSPMFDFPLMAKLTLGRKHWSKLTPPQCEKFTQLFTERLRTSYREKIMFYTDEKVLLKPAMRKKKTICIPMELMSRNKKITILLYKLRKVNKLWKIYDVEIQGVSILLTYRAQFDDILRRGTVEDLLSRLGKAPTH